MRALFSLLGKVLFLFMFVEVIRLIWNSSTIGKLFLIATGIMSLYIQITK